MSFLTEKLKDWIVQLLTIAFNNFDETLLEASRVLTGGVAGFGEAVNLSRTVIAPVCTVILSLCLMTELAIGASKVDRLRMEDGIKLGTKLCLGKVFVDNGPYLLEAIYLQSQSWIASLGGASSATTGELILRNLPAIIDKLDGWGNILGLLATSLIMILAVFVCGLLIKVMAYGRMFEIYAYVVISPLPLAFAPLSGGGEVNLNGITKSFIKSFIGVCLQGVMMLIMLKVFDIIIGNSLNGVVTLIVRGTDNDITKITDLLYTMLLGSIALVVAISKSGSYAKSIVGAG